MLHAFVTAHPLLVQIVCFMLPMLVMMFGPSDGAVRRLWHGLPLRVWQWETMAVMAAVYIVIAVAGNSPSEWIGFAAIVFAHGRNSVMFRLTEQQRLSAASDPHHVECWRWNGLYFVLGEAFWSLYFIDHESWAGLAAVGIFLGYGRWRRWYAGRKAKKVAKGCALERKTGDGPGNTAGVKEIKVCMECRRSPLKILDRGDLPGTHTEVILADGKTICYQCHLNAVIDSYVRPAK